jgi:hypothetical protein
MEAHWAIIPHIIGTSEAHRTHTWALTKKITSQLRKPWPGLPSELQEAPCRQVFCAQLSVQ